MQQTAHTNRRWVLASRPVGIPTAENFRLENAELPEPAEGQMLLRAVYLSLDPYMRGRMSDAPSYAAPVAIGDVMVGATISRVVSSLHPDLKKMTGYWLTVAGRTMPCPTVKAWLIWGRIRSSRHCLWVSPECRVSPRIWD